MMRSLVDSVEYQSAYSVLKMLVSFLVFIPGIYVFSKVDSSFLKLSFEVHVLYIYNHRLHSGHPEILYMLAYAQWHRHPH